MALGSVVPMAALAPGHQRPEAYAGDVPCEAQPGQWNAKGNGMEDAEAMR